MSALTMPRPTGRVHELKTDLDVFDAVADGRKTHEIRLDDRDYQVGDELVLRKTLHSGAQMRAGHALVYVGEPLRVIVTHVLTGYGLQDGWAILSFARVGAQEAPTADAVHHALSPRARLRTSRENVEDVLAALAHVQSTEAA